MSDSRRGMVAERDCFADGNRCDLSLPGARKELAEGGVDKSDTDPPTAAFPRRRRRTSPGTVAARSRLGGGCGRGAMARLQVRELQVCVLSGGPWQRCRRHAAALLHLNPEIPA
jgi:hypothetical protein